MTSRWKLDIRMYSEVAGGARAYSDLSFEMGEFTGADFGAEATAAKSAADQIVAELDVSDIVDPDGKCTRAGIESWSMTNVNGSKASPVSTPLAGANVSDYALITVIYSYTDADTSEKVTYDRNISIPSPHEDIFVAGTKTVDLSSSELQSYITDLSQHTENTQEHSIDTAEGVNGVRKGEWRSRKRR